jgi:hypothetical protein
MPLSPWLLDKLNFAVNLALILLFIILLKKGIGVKIELDKFIQELRLLKQGRVTPDSLNGVGMVGLFIILVVMMILISIAPWRDVALSMVSSSPSSTPGSPPFTFFGFLLTVWVIGMVGSQYLCVQYRKRLDGKQRRSRKK